MPPRISSFLVGVLCPPSGFKGAASLVGALAGAPPPPRVGEGPSSRGSGRLCARIGKGGPPPPPPPPLPEVGVESPEPPPEPPPEEGGGEGGDGAGAGGVVVAVLEATNI